MSVRQQASVTPGAGAPYGDLDAPNVSYRELRATMPSAVRRALPAGRWCDQQLWALPNPVREFVVGDFTWLLELPVWRWRGQRFQVSIRQVLDDPAAFAAHMTKAMATDLRFPIHVMHYRGRLVVLDGYHRLLKALVLERSSIKAVEVTRADVGR